MESEGKQEGEKDTASSRRGKWNQSQNSEQINRQVLNKKLLDLAERGKRKPGRKLQRLEEGEPRELPKAQH